MNLRYAVKDGISGFRRTKLAALGSIITIMISLLLLGLFAAVSMNTARFVETVRGRVEMEVFLQEPLNQKRVAEIQKALLAMDGVDHVEFISKEQAAKIFKQEFGEDINNVLEFNPLPPSFRIYLKEPYRSASAATALQKRLSGVAGIDNVVYRKDILEFLEKGRQTLDMVGLTLGILIAISAIFLVSNTIRLAIASKRKSIQTMKLVGASRWFVRAPFIVEGILQGLIGGIAAAAILFYALTIAAGFVSRELADFISVDLLFYPLVILAGVVLGAFGSALSVKKFIGESVTG